MAEYKAIHGFTVQNRTSDPLAPGISGATWAAGGNVNHIDSERGGSAGTQTAGLLFGGNTPPVLAKTEEYNGTSWTEVNDMNQARDSFPSGAGTQTAALAIGGSLSPPTAGTNLVESYDGTNWTEIAEVNTSVKYHTSCGIQTAALKMAGATNDPYNNNIDLVVW